MVFCNFCRQFSEQDYICPNCQSPLKYGFKVTWQGKDSGNCDRCNYLLPYKGTVWRVNTNYYHVDCYEKKDTGKNVTYTKIPSTTLSVASSINVKDQPETKKNTLFGITFSKSIKKINSFEDADSLDGVNWPTSNLVDKAFENLQKCASHEKIRGVNIVKDMMDLPLAYPGQFARVYKVQKDNSFFALRFFTKKKEGTMLRYKILHDYFEKNFQENNKPVFLINFEYLTNAITINIKRNQIRFPLIKMDWADGETLEKFMSACKNKDEIKIIREQFKKIIDEMEQYGIAHGDLHPKNIIVDKNHKIKLVDYDCMYVEDFKGDSMPELGDPDCQHPNRSLFKYDNNIDHFSALVLYLALMVLEEDPSFSNIRDGEFIFKKEDYLNPHSSDTFKKLKVFSNDVNRLLEILISYCDEKNPKINTLSSILEKTQTL